MLTPASQRYVRCIRQARSRGGRRLRHRDKDEQELVAGTSWQVLQEDHHFMLGRLDHLHTIQDLCSCLNSNLESRWRISHPTVMN